MAGRPLVLGHRGASAVAPENTIAAFSKARELGADGVELDVRRSADGVLIVHHDADDRRASARWSRADVRRAARGAARRSPTLDEALDACRGLVVNAEVKCLPWEPDADRDGSVMRATVDACCAGARRGAVDRLVVRSRRGRSRARVRARTSRPAWLTHGQEVGRGRAHRGRRTVTRG